MRFFSKQGIDRFAQYVNDVKLGLNVERPDLNNEPYSEEFKPQIEIDEAITFETRLEMGKYLTDSLIKQI